MKKKMLITLTALVLVLGVGTAAYAQGEGNFNFGQMLPYMKQMHPDLTNEQLQDMYESCHGTGGSGASQNFEHMNPNQMNRSMMNQ